MPPQPTKTFRQFLAIIMACGTFSCANIANPTFADQLLPENPSSASVEDIFLSLPPRFFEMNAAGRAERLFSSDAKIDSRNKEVVFNGDGGQSTIRMKVVSWTAPDFVVRVQEDGELDKISYLLKRIPGGWRQISSTNLGPSGA